jgi:hypothetical protein
MAGENLPETVSWTIRRDDADNSIEVKFADFDLRALDSATLPSVPVLVDPEVQTLALTWRATAKNTDGPVDGTMVINVDSDPYHPGDVLSDCLREEVEAEEKCR